MELRLRKSKSIFASILIILLSGALVKYLPDIYQMFITAINSAPNVIEGVLSDEGTLSILLMVFLPLFLWLLKINLWDGVIKKKVFFKVMPDGIWTPMVKEGMLVPWEAISDVQLDRNFGPFAKVHRFMISREAYDHFCKPVKIGGFMGYLQVTPGSYDQSKDDVRSEIQKHFEASRSVS